MPRLPGAGASALGSLTKLRASLISERDGLDRRIAALNNAISAFGGGGARTAGARSGGGPRRGSLKEFILKAMAGGKSHYVKDITSSVVKSGYKSKNKTLAKSVGIALAELVASGHVSKRGRGEFATA